MRRIHRNLSVRLVTAGVVAAGAVGLPSAWADTYTDSVITTTAAGQAVGAATSDTDGLNHALLWQADGTLVDLSPAGYTNSGAAGTNGTQQVGAAFASGTGGFLHAVLWSGSAGSVVDLNPTNLPGFDLSVRANGISPDGTQQVGYGYGSATSYNSHALLWSGTANSAVDLNPSYLDNSFAYATDGTHQVGYGNVNGGAHYALLWQGAPGTAVNLHPYTGYTDSFAEGVGGGQEVGYGYTSGTFAIHALLWTGTTFSGDLNPAGYITSFAYGTNGTNQVGYGADASSHGKALVWSGTADSMVDLSSFLPVDGTWTFSAAYSIDDAGDIFGVANGTYGGLTDKFAIEWSPSLIPSDARLSPDVASPDFSDPDYTGTVLYEIAVPAASVPEPATLAVMGIGAFGLLTRRRRDGINAG